MPIADRSPLFVRTYRSGRALCMCGCGEPVNRADRTGAGARRGEPFRYLLGHGRRQPAAERFWTKFEESVDTHCWLWHGAKQAKGYGQIVVTHAGGKQLAHRFAYELLVGPIPEGLTLDHLCRNHNCVNPGHLEPVTSGENVLRGEGLSAQNARKTHCQHGHPLSGENLYVKPNGSRHCRICKRDSLRRWRARP